MKNPNSPSSKAFKFMESRWKAPDYPGGTPRFQVRPFAFDVATFILLPAMAVILSRSVGQAASTIRKDRPRSSTNDGYRADAAKSQVIVFGGAVGKGGVLIPARRAPGTLVKLKLLNVVESYSATPVHAQIIDNGLGNSFLGGILVGEGNSDKNFDRINISFNYARNPNRENQAFSISARALSLNGTLGLEATKKEGAFARAVYGAGNSGAAAVQGNLDSMDLKSIIVKALSSGLAHEFGEGAEIERNRASVLSLQPGTEFFAELTDYFPSSGSR